MTALHRAAALGLLVTLGTSPALAQPEEPAEEPASATEECGRDRRCRIARLRRLRNTARAQRSAQLHRDWVAIRERQVHYEYQGGPRGRRAWVLENPASDTWFGWLFGFHPIPQFFVGIGAGIWFAQGHSIQMGPNDSGYVWLSTALQISARLRWLLFEEVITPYVGLGMDIVTLGSGGANVYHYDPEGPAGGTATNEYGSLETHALNASVGVDLQLDFGLRVHIGAVVRPLIYALAKHGDEPLPDMERWVKESWRMFGMQGGLGWAF